MSRGPTVRCRGLGRVYRQGEVEVPALRDVDLEVAAGEFLCLSGPSGSGKTTLLNLVGGLDRPTSGEVEVVGRRLNDLSNTALARLRLRHLGFVFQAYNLIPVLSARENVEFVLQLQGMGTAARRERALALLAEVGLAELAERRPAELSGGQQQRVAVARALVSHPELVLADEPTANLDSASAERLMRLLRRMNREHGVTFIFSTHDPRVMEHAHRLLGLRDGRIVEDRRLGAG